MKRILSLIAALAIVFAAIGFALQQPASFPLLDWAKKAPSGKPRVAVLLEFGLKDAVGRDWSGQAVVSGAKVVHREGYRFRDKDELVNPNGWQAKSRPQIRVPKGQPAVAKLVPPATVGIVLHLEDVNADAKIALTLPEDAKADVNLADVLAGKSQSLLGGAAIARLVTSATPVATTKAEEDFPAACHGPDGTLWVAYIAYTNRVENRRIEAPQLKAQPENFKTFYKPEFGDQLLIKSLKNGKWSDPIAITDAKQDIARCAIGATKDGDVWLAYCPHRDKGFEMCVRRLSADGKLDREQRLQTSGQNCMNPVMAITSDGYPWLAVQSWNDKGQAGIDVFNGGPEAWGYVTRIEGTTGENCWHPAITGAPDGRIAVAYDIYRAGSYDVRVTIMGRGRKSVEADMPIAASAKYEARPAAVYDPQGRLWIAYEEGPENWGKDFGSLAPGKGNPLYSARSVRVVCLDTDGKLKKPSAELPTSTVVPPAMAGDATKTNQFEKGSRFAYPKLGIDGLGRVWLAYRRNFGSRYSSHAGAYWITFARRLGDTWSDEIEVHHSDGLLDHRPVLLPHAGGGLTIIHNTDGRYTTPEGIDNQIYASVIDLPKSHAPTLIAHEAGENKASAAIAAENASTKRMREHRVKAAGKTYQYLRGEYHRHTEISWDGSPDGSLEDMFRYAIDAAQFDWIGNADHDNGAGREYLWWLTQKFTDAYHTSAFTTMFTYERSVPYPHGHRNVMFAQRGILTLPRLKAPDDPPDEKQKEGKKGGWPGGVHSDDTKMLYRYLREFDGICASHTSATGMGTDWRDNDPVVEPIVEIYQGDRMSYEMEAAPRVGYEPKSGKEPANVAGWYPKGYVNLALQKGVKFGFQASSDHWSTHISYFIILAEGRDRKSLLDAVKKRHCYAATDNILVDFRCGTAIMGDDVKVNGAPKFDIHVVGTANVAKIDILRDSEVIDTLKPDGRELNKNWTDPNPRDGTHYYYIRVLQTDGEIAWGSPIWVQRQ